MHYNILITQHISRQNSMTKRGYIVCMKRGKFHVLINIALISFFEKNVSPVSESHTLDIIP